MNNENAVITPEGVDILEEKTPIKVKKVEVEIQSDKEDSASTTNSDVGELIYHITNFFNLQWPTFVVFKSEFEVEFTFSTS